MQQQCAKCGRRYDDETCSTVCPHRSIGFCVVCDDILCVCDPSVTRDFERSRKAAMLQSGMRP